jgi:hypothetical protein
VYAVYAKTKNKIFKVPTILPVVYIMFSESDSLKNLAGSLKVFGRQVLSVYLCTIETHDE